MTNLIEQWQSNARVLFPLMRDTDFESQAATIDIIIKQSMKAMRQACLDAAPERLDILSTDDAHKYFNKITHNQAIDTYQQNIRNV